MAAARQCDICGNMYSLYNAKNDENKTNGVMFVNIDKDDRYWSHKVKDCCPECMDSIKAHIDMLKRKGEKGEKEMEECS